MPCSRSQAGASSPCVLLIQHLHALAVAGADGNDTEEEHVGGVLSRLLAGGNSASTTDSPVSTTFTSSGRAGVPDDPAAPAGAAGATDFSAVAAAVAPCLVIGCTDKPPAELPGRFVGSFVHVLPVAAPSEEERTTLLAHLLRQVAHDSDGLSIILLFGRDRLVYSRPALLYSLVY
jgi:hypothetical protein